MQQNIKAGVLATVFIALTEKKTTNNWTLHTINLIAYVSNLLWLVFLVILGFLIPSSAAPPYSSEKDIRRCPDILYGVEQ